MKFITNFRMVHEDSGWPRARLLLLRGDRFYGFILSQDYYVTWASEKEKKELNCSAHNSRKKQDFPSNIRMAILLIYQFHLSFVWKSSTSSWLLSTWLYKQHFNWIRATIFMTTYFITHHVKWACDTKVTTNAAVNPQITMMSWRRSLSTVQVSSSREIFNWV